MKPEREVVNKYLSNAAAPEAAALTKCFIVPHKSLNGYKDYQTAL